jgi:hypothetical protein
MNLGTRINAEQRRCNQSTPLSESISLSVSVFAFDIVINSRHPIAIAIPIAIPIPTSGPFFYSEDLREFCGLKFIALSQML